MESNRPNSTHKSRRIIFLLFTSILLIGELGFYLTPLSVTRIYQQYTITSDGVTIDFDVYEPAHWSPSLGLKTAIILGHGFMVNKAVMSLLAINLAEEGFVAVTFDFRSHGWSLGDFNGVAEPIKDAIVNMFLNHEPIANMTQIIGGAFTNVSIFLPLLNDLRAIKTYLAGRGDINMTNLGYVGYSMGGGVGFMQLANDTDFKAFVAIAPLSDPEFVNTTRPANLLILGGQNDEIIDRNNLYNVIEKRTGTNDSDFKLGHLYGSFTDGSAAELDIIPGMEHLIAAYNIEAVQKTTEWMVSALYNPYTSSIQPSDLSTYFALLVFFFFQIIGALGIFAIIASTLLGWLKKRNQLKDEHQNLLILPITQPIIEKHSTKHLIGTGLIYIAVLSFPCMLLVFPLFLTNLVIGGSEVMFLLGPAIAIWIFQQHLYRKEKITVKQQFAYWKATSSRINIGIGLLLGLILLVLLQISFGTLVNLIPGGVKWYSVGFIYLGVVFCFFSYINFFQLFIQEKLKQMQSRFMLLKLSVSVFAINFIIAAFVVFLPGFITGSYFVAMFLIPMGVIMGLVSFISVYFYNRSKDLLISVLTVSFFVACYFCAMSPSVWIPALF